MSVVIRESHATNDQPMFLSLNGGEVSGLVRVGAGGAGDIQTSSALAFYNPSTILTRGRITANDAGTMFLQGNQVNFTQIGTGNANTTLAISPAGTNGDVLTVGGSILGIGPLPSSTTLDAASKPVALGTPANFTVSSPIFPLVAGAEYDVQCNGYWTVGSPITPATTDYAQVRLAVGSGTAPGYFNFTYDYNEFPAFTEDPWTANSFRPFKIRARMISNGIPAMLLEAAIYSPLGTGVYNGVNMTITTLDIVRVK